MRALVFGQYAEASADVHALLRVAAEGMAQREWKRLGARSYAEARAFYISSLRRQMGIAVAREMARHRLRRVPMIGVPREVLLRRRALGQVGNGGLQLGPADAPTTFDFLVHPYDPGS